LPIALDDKVYEGNDDGGVEAEEGRDGGSGRWE
jgi:hypothetical protein